MLSTTELLMRRRTGVVSPKSYNKEFDKEAFDVVSAAENKLQRLGYTLDGDAITAFLHADVVEATEVLNAVVRCASQLVGATDWRGNPVPVTPMYPNFPRQVEEASDSELYLNAILHYIGSSFDVRIMPKYDKIDRGETIKTRPLRVISLIADEQKVLNELLTDLIGQKASWSLLDRADIKLLLELNAVADHQSFAARTNLAYFVADTGDTRLVQLASSYTDVLRIAVATAGGNPEFVVPTTRTEALKSIPRRFRKAIVEQLDLLISDAGGVKKAVSEADMRSRSGLWKLVGKLLHVGEYRNKFPQVLEFFAVVRSNSLPISARGQIQTGAVAGKKRDDLRAKNPGQFARDLDWALRTSDNPQRTLNAFKKVSGDVSSKVLWSAENALRNRDADIRAFLPKGKATKAQFSRETLPVIDNTLLKKTHRVLHTALTTKYSQFSPVPQDTKVWIDPVLNDYAVPFAVREQGKATRVLGCGSRIKLASSEYVRFFMWWKNQANGARVDLDMSLSFLNDKFEVVSEVAFYNLRNDVAVHSGDIVSAPNGAAEYIDIRYEELAKQKGAKYVVMSVLSYTRQHFKDIPEATAGVMLREDLTQGEVFDPKTVETAFSVIQDASGVTPFILDIETRELIWLDFALTKGWYYTNNLAAGQRSKFSQMAEATVTRSVVSVGELVATHVVARGGTIVDTPAEAEVHYGPEVAFEVDVLLSQWL